MAEEAKKIWTKPEITQIADVNLDTENAISSGGDIGLLQS